MENTNEKAEAKEPKPKKPPGYRKFEKLLKQVVTAAPLRKINHGRIIGGSGGST